MSVLSFCVYKVHHQFGIRNCIMADIADILMTSSFVSSIYKNGMPSAVPSSAQGVYTIWCAWLIDMVSHCAGMHSWSDPALTINVQMYSAKRSSTPCFSKQLLFLLFDQFHWIDRTRLSMAAGESRVSRSSRVAGDSHVSPVSKLLSYWYRESVLPA